MLSTETHGNQGVYAKHGKTLTLRIDELPKISGKLRELDTSPTCIRSTPLRSLKVREDASVLALVDLLSKGKWSAVLGTSITYEAKDPHAEAVSLLIPGQLLCPSDRERYTGGDYLTTVYWRSATALDEDPSDWSRSERSMTSAQVESLIAALESPIGSDHLRTANTILADYLPAAPDQRAFTSTCLFLTRPEGSPEAEDAVVGLHIRLDTSSKSPLLLQPDATGTRDWVVWYTPLSTTGSGLAT